MSEAVLFMRDFPLLCWTSYRWDCQCLRRARGTGCNKHAPSGGCMARKTFFILFIVSLVTLSQAQSKRAMTIDDLITTIRVADPQLSPDGRRVIFARTATALDSGRRNSDIW